MLENGIEETVGGLLPFTLRALLIWISFPSEPCCANSGSLPPEWFSVILWLTVLLDCDSVNIEPKRFTEAVKCV
jgi:hypothetical protein